MRRCTHGAPGGDERPRLTCRLMQDGGHACCTTSAIGSHASAAALLIDGLGECGARDAHPSPRWQRLRLSGPRDGSGFPMHHAADN